MFWIALRVYSLRGLSNIDDQIDSHQQQMNDFSQFFEALGKAVILIFLISVPLILSPVIWSFLIRPKLTSSCRSKAKSNIKGKSWAIITGCTDGIGLGFAKNLAQKGFNLCLISRNKSKLDDVKEKLLLEYHQCGQIKIVVFDFSSTDYQVIEKAIKSLPSIDLLINNVGVVSCPRDPPLDFFCEIGKNMHLRGININLISCVKMTSIVLPIMESQGSGTIVHLSSILGTKPSPLTSVYGGTKTFIDFFGRSLSLECAEKQIRVTTLTPSFVRTKVNKMRTNITIPSPDKFAESAFRIIRHESRSTGFWAHQIMYRLVCALSVLTLKEYWENYVGLKMFADLMDITKQTSNLPFEPHPFKDDFVSSTLRKLGLVNPPVDFDWLIYWHFRGMNDHLQSTLKECFFQFFTLWKTENDLKLSINWFNKFYIGMHKFSCSSKACFSLLFFVSFKGKPVNFILATLKLFFHFQILS